MMTKTKLCNVANTRWGFYEAFEADDKETMADYFETLYTHYQNRGKLLKRIQRSVMNDGRN